MPKRGVGLRDGRDRAAWGVVDQFGAVSGRYYPGAGWRQNETTADTLTTDQTLFRPFVAHTDFMASALGIEVTTLQASGLLRLGLYAANPDNGNLPGRLVADLGTVDASTNGGGR